MDKKTLLAFVIIGAILIAFSVYNTRVAERVQREQFIQDSIAAALAPRPEAAQDAAPQETAVTLAMEGTAPADSAAAPRGFYANDFLNRAMQGEEQFSVLENKLLRLQFSNQGARPTAALVKNFTAYGGGDLVLFDGPRNRFDLSFYAGENITTGNFFFSPAPADPGALAYRLYLDSLSYVEYRYTLPEDTYLLDLEVKMVGMNKFIPRNATNLYIDWEMDLLRQEKGYNNEKNYSTVVYRYPDSKKTANLGMRKAEGQAQLTTRFEWVAFQQQFFSAILVAPELFDNGKLTNKFYPETDEDHRLMRSTAAVQVPFANEREVNIPFHLYVGPNKYNTLKAYDRGFEKIVPLGGRLVSWINRYVIIPFFNLLNKFIGSYGLIILIMTIFLKLVISPLTFKSYMSSAKMRVLKPELDKINAKYPRKEDAMKKQQETMALYKKTGVSMFGGCLPSLIQFPILFAMFRFFPSSFELRQQPFLWAEDLSAFDSVLNLPFNIPLYGSHVSLFALIMAVTMYFFSKMNLAQQPQNSQQMPGMNGMMLYFMPLMMLVICNNLSSALTYYYMLSNLLSMLQTWITRRFLVDEEKLYKQLQTKAATVSGQAKKSKWQLRLEEMQRQQQQMQRNNRR